MHHTPVFNPTRKAAKITCYSDDSASHEESKYVVVGGTVMNQFQFWDFDRDWQEMLKEHEIEYLHMTDFVKPNGRYSTKYPEFKMLLFRTAAGLINKYKQYSVSVAVPQVDFKQYFSMEVYRKLMGPYAVAFLSVLIMNSHAADIKYLNPIRISYLADKGAKHHHIQLDAAHTVVVDWENKHKMQRTGAIAFDYDHRVSALQAADAIAWIYHAIQEYGLDNIENEFSPLLDIFKPEHKAWTWKLKHFHLEKVIPRGGIEILANGINRWIAENGSIPALLTDMLKVPRYEPEEQIL